MLCWRRNRRKGKGGVPPLRKEGGGLKYLPTRLPPRKEEEGGEIGSLKTSLLSIYTLSRGGRKWQHSDIRYFNRREKGEGTNYAKIAFSTPSTDPGKKRRGVRFRAQSISPSTPWGRKKGGKKNRSAMHGDPFLPYRRHGKKEKKGGGRGRARIGAYVSSSLSIGWPKRGEKKRGQNKISADNHRRPVPASSSGKEGKKGGKKGSAAFRDAAAGYSVLNLLINSARSGKRGEKEKKGKKDKMLTTYTRVFFASVILLLPR